MERAIALTASLPETSKNRLKLTDTIIDTLWDSLQHPPLSYMGNKFQYRQPDGSYNASSTVLPSVHLAYKSVECSRTRPRKSWNTIREECKDREEDARCSA